MTKEPKRKYKINVFEDSFNIDRCSFTELDVRIVEDKDSHVLLKVKNTLADFSRNNFVHKKEDG